MIRLLDRYFMKEIAAPFFLGLTLLTLLMLLYQFLRLTEWVVEKGVSLSAVAGLFIKLLPSFFLMTIPMATAFAVLIAVNRLVADGEWMALYASGVSFFRLLLPVFAFSVVASGAAFVMGALSSPWDSSSIRSAAVRILQEKIGVGFEAGQFTEILPGVMIYAASKPTPSEMRHVFIYDGRVTRHPRIIAADRGFLINPPDGGEKGLYLENGMLRSEQPGVDHQMTFGSYQLRIKTEDPAMGAAPPSEKETLRGLMAFHKRYALAFAAFLFGLLGVPLGLLSGRVGRVGIVVGIGLILFYHALTLGGEALALSHRIAPWMAAWLPNGVLIPMTLLLLGCYAGAPRPFLALFRIKQA